MVPAIIGKRKVYAEVPPRVEYSLSDYGKSLLPLIEAIGEWGRGHTTKFGELIEAKRTRTRKPQLKLLAHAKN